MNWLSALAVATMAMMLIVSNIAAAKPKISVKTKYYSITGKTTSELLRQMKRKGPRGYWAYTSWYVRWSGNCRTSVEIKYTYPKWTNKSQAAAAVQKKWNRMMAALKRHEEQHGRHGINAATEIEASKCAGNPKKITSKWARQDKIYDRKTKHGWTEGVKLP